MIRFLTSVCFAALATSAFAADLTVPTQDAARQVSGYGEIYGGGFWFDEISDDHFWAAGGAGRINVPFAESWNAQGDFTVDAIGRDGESMRALGGAMHVYWRDPDAYAFGGFAAIKSYGASSFTVFDMWDWTVGPEAQVYFGNVTLYGQAYYGGLEWDSFPGDYDRMGARGVVRYFAQENLRFDAEIAFDRTDFAGDYDVDTVALGLQGTYRFADTPWSMFGRYQYESISVTGTSDDIGSHKLTAGLRASFGGRTLLDEDRNGATMDTYRRNFPTPAAFVIP